MELELHQTKWETRLNNFDLGTMDSKAARHPRLSGDLTATIEDPTCVVAHLLEAPNMRERVLFY